MKKLLIILLALLLALTCVFALSACKDEPETPPATEEPGDEGGDDTPPSPQNFTVTFSGVGVTTPPQLIKSGGKVTPPKTPTREGYRFEGWLYNGAVFDFNTVVISDMELTASWVLADTETINGSGTETDPYMIYNAKQLLAFAERVNDPENNVGFHSAFFKLGADINMAGVTYTPAGKTVVLNEGEPNEETVNGFGGVFDGDGHTIKGLSLERTLRADAYMGLFGVVNTAAIKNLNVEYAITVNAYSDQYIAFVGGVAAHATLTNFENVHTKGTVVTNVMEDNTLYIGGIAGRLSSSSESGEAYILFAENCYAEIDVSISTEEGAAVGSGVSGGLFGMIYSYDGAVSVINCGASGTVVGGMAAGGVIGDITGNYISVINCMSTCRVETKSADGSYAGGLVGASRGDNTLLDSYATGRVVGKVGNSTFMSYAGGLIGYATKDDYESYYTAGTAIVNCFYSGNIGGNADRTNTAGTHIYASELSKEWVLATLKWDAESWTFENGIGKAEKPTAVLASDLRDTPVLNLQNGSTPNNVNKPIDSMYSIIGQPDALPNAAPNVFFGWEMATDVPARFYVPVIKNMTLTARWQNVTDIVGYYTGTATLHESRNAGVIILKDNGEAQWIVSGVSNGTYTYNGTNLMLSLDGSTISATLVDGELNFVMDAGMSGEVIYAMEKDASIRYIGEYFSPAGDIITFGETGKVSFQSALLGINENDFRYKDATYTEAGYVLTLTSNSLSSYFSTMTITVNPTDDTLTVTFTAKNPGGVSVDGVTFSRADVPDYTGQAFVGTYNLTTPTWNTAGTGYQTNYTLVLNADGSANYISEFSNTEARYYYFPQSGVIKLILENNVSTFTYDAESGILYGWLNRGVIYSAVLAPASQGDIRCFMIGGTKKAVFVTDTGTYFCENGVYHKDAIITGTFADGNRVTLNGQAYIAQHNAYYSGNGRTYYGYDMAAVGAEEGTYTYNGNSIVLNGIGGVSGTKTGFYLTYGDLVVIVYDDDTVFGFDHAAAKAAANVATEAPKDAFQGVWYYDKVDNSTTPANVTEKYYKFFIDGYGHTMVYYLSSYDGLYHQNWGGLTWGTYTANATGVACTFNANQYAEVRFYYDMKLAYSDQFGVMGQMGLYAEGYTGAMTPPTMPTGTAGKYTGNDASGNPVIFNLNADLTGSYQGVPFIAVYDGEGEIIFTYNGQTCRFDIATKAMTVGSADPIILTAGGQVTERVPSALSGTWTGVFEGYGTNGDARTITVDTAGNVTYESIALAGFHYDAATFTITGTYTDGGGTWTVTLVYSLESGTMSATMVNEEYTTLTATLTKS